MFKLLWDKGEALDKVMHELTVGNDYLIDKELIAWDCIGSAAHARMLETIKILSPEDVAALLKELKNIHALALEGKLNIPPELEDAHNFIENLLVEKIGEVGLRIHAGRSRNDQILVTVRLYLRYVLVQVLLQLIDFIQISFQRYDELKDISMPGYTHAQPAMPSSVGMWLHAFIEEGLGLLREGLMLIDIININPLGASAGFASNLPLDRELTTKLLGFNAVQRSAINCNNSRGKFEHKVLCFAENIAGMFEKLACDIMLYTTQEYGFFKLPVELTTGSSIMPQKRNSDLAELLRGRAAKVRAASSEIALVIYKLNSSYNRDHQYTKEPLMRGIHELKEMFRMADLLIERFSVNKERLEAVMYPELYATYEANNLAKSGVPYRMAYKIVAEKVKGNNYDSSGLEKDFAYIAKQTDKYANDARAELVELAKKVNFIKVQFEKVEEKIFD